ncbi:hypothetical protein FGL01_29570 [Flavobacterium glycines]|uniref:Uncharacterized protein n=1 Tax=Flavobacterium glycines TaxID=551990 RepID=A0A511CPF3_9FLAO|nr:hypothetical protein FGL01_29570 [Flavobacterium glycines]
MDFVSQFVPLLGGKYMFSAVVESELDSELQFTNNKRLRRDKIILDMIWRLKL